MYIREVFSFVAKELSNQHIPCILVGGLAVSAYRPARNTSDIDFLIDQSYIETVIKLIEKLGYTPFQKNENFVRLEVKGSTSPYVDFLLVDKDTFDKMWQEGKKCAMEGLEIMIPSINHLISMKLHAMKNNKRRELKDLLDVLEIVKQNNINIKSVEFKNLCLKYGTEDLYNKICEAFN